MKTTLFARIFFRLCIPLLFLGTVFVAIELTQQVRTLNEVHRFKSQRVFLLLQKKLSKEIRKQTTLGENSEFKKQMDHLAMLHHLPPIQIFDNSEHRLILGEGEPWADGDFENAEQSIEQKKSGKSIYIISDRQARQWIAYMPLKNKTGQFFVAKVRYSLADLKQAFAASQSTLVLIISLIVLVGIAIGQGLAQSIIRPLQAVNEATREIMSGHLGKHVEIKTGDEIQMLADTFNKMSDTLKTMKQQAVDTNPLTELPGNQSIFQEIKKRIFERQKFVLFHTDLDRFKVFNDHYGLAKGDEAIRKTAGLLQKCVKEKGAPDDFLGHQGGDDFVILTRPQRAKELAELICSAFDKEVVAHLYSAEDLKRGHTFHMDRRRFTETGEEVMVSFPLLAISLAGLSNAKRDFADYFAVMNEVTEVKKEVKKTVQSSFLIQE